MMKASFSILIISICYVTVQCSPEDLQKQADMLRQVCQPKFKITDEQVQFARDGKFIDDKNFKCYIHCIFEMMGVMKKNKVNYDQALKQFELLPDEYKGPWKKALNICREKVVVAKQPCDFALNMLKCFYENNEKYGFV